MAQKSKKVNEEPVVEKTEEQSCECCSKSKLKTGTILVSALAVGAIAIWAIAANNWIRLPGLSTLTSDSKVIATVDGDPVYMSEVETLVSQVPQLAELPFEDIYPQLVKDVVAEKVLKKAVESRDQQAPFNSHYSFCFLFPLCRSTQLHPSAPSFQPVLP